MTKTKKITLWLLAVVTVLLVAWDVHVATNSVKGDTISEAFLNANSRGLIFALGVICGHLAWPQYIKRKSSKERMT